MVWQHVCWAKCSDVAMTALICMQVCMCAWTQPEESSADLYSTLHLYLVFEVDMLRTRHLLWCQ